MGPGLVRASSFQHFVSLLAQLPIFFKQNGQTEFAKKTKD